MEDLQMSSLLIDGLVNVAIRNALAVYKAPRFKIWAEGWLAGGDRRHGPAAFAAASAWADSLEAAQRRDGAAAQSSSAARQAAECAAVSLDWKRGPSFSFAVAVVHLCRQACENAIEAARLRAA